MRVLALVIHGIGSQKEGYSLPFRDLVTRHMPTAEGAERVDWREIYWQNILAGRQRDYLEAADRAGRLRLDFVRRIVVGALGDAAAYQPVASTTGANTTYRKVHERVAGTLSDGFAAAAGEPLAVVFLAHSLGGHIVSNFVWDEQKAALDKQRGTGLGPAGWMDRFVGFVTFGCNIPLFTFAYDPVTPIAFPPPGLAPELQPHAQWRNYFAPTDYLGYPLKPVSPAYDAVVTADERIGVTGGLIRRLVNAHELYWRSGELIRPVARYLGRLAAL